MCKEKEAMEKEIREYVRKRNEEIRDAYANKHIELSKRAQALKADDTDFMPLVLESQIAMAKALKETKEMILLTFGAIPAFLKPFYRFNLKALITAMEQNENDREYYEETTKILEATFGVEVITIPDMEKRK